VPEIDDHVPERPPDRPLTTFSWRAQLQIGTPVFPRSRASERQSRTPAPVCCSCLLNPIEQWFAKLKALLRKAAARTFDALINAIAQALETFPQTNAKTISQIQDIQAKNENAPIVSW
jgi:hypothetical protein